MKTIREGAKCIITQGLVKVMSYLGRQARGDFASPGMNMNNKRVNGENDKTSSQVHRTCCGIVKKVWVDVECGRMKD